MIVAFFLSPACACQVLLRDSKSALEDFKAAIKLSPHSAHIYFNRANLYTAMGQHEKAEKDYTKGRWTGVCLMQCSVV